jgi:hypothetical protein
MSFETTIQRVTTDLITTFDQLDAFFEYPLGLRVFQPAANWIF